MTHPGGGEKAEHHHARPPPLNRRCPGQRTDGFAPEGQLIVMLTGEMSKIMRLPWGDAAMRGVVRPAIRRLAAALLVLSAVLGAPPAMASESAASFAASAASPAECTGPASGTWLRVVVDGLRNGQGQVAITLYADDSSRFLVKHGSLYVGRTRAVAPVTNSCIYVPHPGVYVLALYHDENANQKFDRTAIGLPAEGYGFSNNPSTLFGLPSFSSVRINVSRSGMTAHVHMKYP